MKKLITSNKKIFQTILCLIFSIFAMKLATPIQVYASSNSNSLVQQIVTEINSTSDNSSGGNDAIPNGISRTRTGYLCYLLKADGTEIPDMKAYAFMCPNYNGISGSSFKIVKSRKGNYTVNSWKDTAPWNCSPWTAVGDGSTVETISNEPTIRAWLASPSADNVPNAKQFVKDNWGTDAAQKFSSNEYILIIETLLNFQYSEKESGYKLTQTEKTAIIQDKTPKAKAKAKFIVNKMTDNALKSEFKALGWETVHTSTDKLKQEYINYLASTAVNAYIEQLESSGSGRKLVGSPVIGTLPNLLQYRKDIECKSNPFESYTNKVAPHAEKIVTSEAGFTAYIGGVNKLTDKEVMAYGVGMLIVHCSDTPLAVTD